MMRWRIAEDYAAAVIFRFLLAAIILFLIVPIGVAVILSFDDREFIGAFPPTRFSLRWYRAFMQNPSYLDGLVVSLKLALVATMISIVAGAEQPIALAESQWRGRDVVETLFLSPKFVPTVVIGFSILGFASAIHVLRCVHPAGHGARRDHHPVHGSGDAGELSWAFPRSLGEAACRSGRRRGARSSTSRFRSARTGIIAGGLMAFVLSFDEVAVSIFLTDAFTQTLPIALVAEMRANLNLTVAAISTVLATMAVIIVLILDRAAGLDNVIGRGMYRG